MVRKKGKLPGKTCGFTYDLEYGTDTIEIQEDAIAPGSARASSSTILLATGGTISAAIDLVSQQGGNVVGAACIIELSFFNGRSRLPVPVTAMVAYDS